VAEAGLAREVRPGRAAPDEARIDRWLCAVRVVKTRPLVTRLCEGGHVGVNGMRPSSAATSPRSGGAGGSWPIGNDRSRASPERSGLVARHAIA
jgi:hypothetical protein